MSSSVPRAPRPLHRYWRFVGVVAAGGVVGTACREGFTFAVPEAGSVPWLVFGINVLGALALGFLTAALVRRGADRGVRRVIRLGLGTGLLGGFTTYSTLAVGVASLAQADENWRALAYGLGSVLAGALAAFAGILLAVVVRPGRERAA
ncbi:MAG TPA: CrcB family protein [Microbacteriaceae bacterium]|nr:CrcB family protein [Microbacteriaceae bacterium]